MPIEYRKRLLNFYRPAKTSRDVMQQRVVYYLLVYDNDLMKAGIGECSPIFGLSPETKDDFERTLMEIAKFDSIEKIPQELLLHNPSIRFAVETAKADFANNGEREIFGRSNSNKIPINGLVWMNESKTMLDQAFEKIEAGFNCIKLKIGGLDFAQEIEILKIIRERYSSDLLEIRLDANGAFSPEEALDKLEQLSEFTIHSIEQPIKQGQWKVMQSLCMSSPIPVALDEELIPIGIDKKQMLDQINPQYIILKPTLHGGFSGCDEWIKLAAERNIDWWATSALESNIGLNAIAQWVSTYDNPLPQGLGTGKLYVDNIPSPLMSGNGYFWWDETLPWQVESLLSETSNF